MNGSDPHGERGRETYPSDNYGKMSEEGEYHSLGNESLGSPAVRPVFLGNLMPNYGTDDIIDAFERPEVLNIGHDPVYVDRVDIKRGYCFVFLKDAKTREDKKRIEAFVGAISGIEIRNVSRAVRAEFARGDGRVKRKEDERRQNIAPSDTLFVVNFHEETTRKEDLEMLFQPFGELVRIDLKRNYAFVQFKTIEEATKAKESTNGGKIDQSVLTVEYVARQRVNDNYHSMSRGPDRREHFDDRRRFNDDRRRFDDDRRRLDDDRRPIQPPRDLYNNAPPAQYDRRRYDDDRYGRPAVRRNSPPPYRRPRSRSRSPPPPPPPPPPLQSSLPPSYRRSRSPPPRGRYEDDYPRGGAGGSYRGRSRSPSPRGRGYSPDDRGRDFYRGSSDRERGYRG